ncbi:MAG TPA: thioredoxin fold domain-containing protein [Burkholderiales bacterium]|nr:thioredoxin fold domain-containing protein [Burkholderiales bacterium]
MKWFLVFALLLPGFSSAEEPPAWFTDTLLDFREDVADAARERKRVMVYFGQDGCPYCKRLMEVNFKDPTIVAKMRRHFMAIALNIYGDREVTWTDGRTMSEKQLAAALRVQFTPTLVFFDEKGGEALRINGYLPPDRFLAALDSALMGSPKTKPLAAKPGRLTAILVVSPKCAACDELERDSLKRPEVRALLDKFEFVRKSEAKPVGYVPSLILYDRSGREVLRTEAYLRPFHLAAALDYVASGAHAREPSFQRFLQARAEEMRSRGQAVNLWD